MRIGLTYNLKPAGATGDQYEEFDSVETIESLEAAMRANGHEPVRLGWGREMLDALEREQVDGVFNIAEGVGGRSRESQVPATLEMLGIPCSGSDAVAIGITLDKALAKLLARSGGIATAPWEVLHNQREVVLRFPLFAKPAAEGSSMGITATSRCETPDELKAAVDRLLPYGPVLVEEYLPGDEYTVGIVDGEVIGVMQVVPITTEEHFIYSIEVKRDYLNRVRYRFLEAPDVATVALSVWRAFGLRDVARVDIRRDRAGVPNFVEVNPLPGVHPVNSDLIILARGFGWTYEQLIGRVVAAAEKRWRASQ
ncbi:MAG: D-alanine--D-alanine ligase [Acidobacteriota bacterium]